MKQFFVYDSDTPDSAQLLPFGVFAGTAAPSDAVGSNGDYFYRTNNGDESIYKKVGGSWQLISSGGAYTQEVIESSGQTEFNPSLDFTDNQNIDVFENGQLKEEAASLGAASDEQWVRDSALNKITFKTTRPSSSRILIRVYNAAVSIGLPPGIDYMIGEASDVSNGNATHTSLQDAHDAAGDGDVIGFLANRDATGGTLTKRVTIQGFGGNSSNFTSAVTFDTGSNNSMVTGVRFAQNVTVNNGVKGIYLSNSYIAAGKILTDNNPTDADSVYILVQEV